MLKRIQDCTYEELLGLSDEAVQWFIEIEWAYEGIAPVQSPGPKPEAPKIEPTIVAYQVGNLVFSAADQAQAVASMSSLMKEEYNYECGYKYTWLVPQDAPKVDTVKHYEHSAIEEHRGGLIVHKKALADWEKLNQEFTNFQKKTEAITASVWGTVHAARSKRDEIDDARKLYDRYIELAKGDTQIAGNFFRRAFPGRPDLMTAVLPDEPAPDSGAAVPESSAV